MLRSVPRRTRNHKGAPGPRWAVVEGRGVECAWLTPYLGSDPLLEGRPLFASLQTRQSLRSGEAEEVVEVVVEEEVVVEVKSVEVVAAEEVGR